MIWGYTMNVNTITILNDIHITSKSNVKGLPYIFMITILCIKGFILIHN